MTKFLSQITWARWRVHDPFMPMYSTSFVASVVHPSYEYPTPTVMMSVVNGGGRTLMRFLSVQDLQAAFVIPDEYKQRLTEGYAVAVREANKIQMQLRTMMRVGNLPPGGQVVRTDTGEIIAEAERIIREDKANG